MNNPLYMLLLPYKELLSLFKNKIFILLFSSQVLGGLSLFLDYMAIISLLIFHWHLAGKSLALLSTMYALPMMIVSPFVGIYINHWPLRKIMYGSCFIMAAMTFPLLFVKHACFLLLFIFFRNTAEVFHLLARSIIIKSAFVEQELITVNSIIQFISQSSKIVGPLLGGVLLVWFKPKFIFIITFFNFILLTAILYFLPHNLDKVVVSKKNHYKKSFLKEIKDGINPFKLDFSLFLMLLGFFGAFFSLFISNNFLSLVVKNIGLKETFFGLLPTFLGIGGAVGAILLTFAKKKNILFLISIGLLLVGVGSFFIGLSPSISINIIPFVILLMCFIIGLGESIVIISSSVLLQYRLSINKLGPVNSLLNSIVGLNLLIAPIVGTIIISFLSTSAAFFASWIIAWIFSFIIFKYTKTLNITILIK